MDQSLQLFIGGLAVLVGLQDDAEDVSQLLAAARHALSFVSFLLGVFRELLQQLLHWEREGDGVASCAIAMPCHVCLLIKYGGLSPVLALHGKKDHACEARGGASQFHGSHLFLVDPFQPIACPHVVSVAERRQPSCLEMLHAILANRKLALLAQHFRPFSVSLMMCFAAMILKGLAGVKRQLAHSHSPSCADAGDMPLLLFIKKSF